MLAAELALAGVDVAVVERRETQERFTGRTSESGTPSVAARVLRNTQAQGALRRLNDPTKALQESLAELLAMDEPCKNLAAEMSGLGVHYDLGKGHPLLGRRMPDLDLVASKGPQRVFSLLHKARPALLNFDASGAFDLKP